MIDLRVGDSGKNFSRVLQALAKTKSHFFPSDCKRLYITCGFCICGGGLKGKHMANKAQKHYPAITGLAWHRHQYYSFFTPIDWHRFAWPDDSPGEIYGPDQDDPLTVFAVALQDLGTPVVAGDLEIVAEGFFEAIEQLPEAHVEERGQKVAGKLLELEAKYTFLDQGQTRKCWVRVFYHETRQITMTAQGATPEKYDYWLPMFFQAMMTARVHKEKPSFDIFD
jgi:hypothetical protein